MKEDFKAIFTASAAAARAVDLSEIAAAEAGTRPG